MTPELNKALVKLQGQLPHIPKGETGKVEGVSKNGQKFSYTYTYADLHGVSAAILPLMSAVGLAFTARPTINEAGRFVLAYSLLHESGESLDGEYLLPDPERFKQQDIGGVITYARRYCLCAVTGVAPAEDDDDAQAASKAKPAPQSRARAPQKPTAAATTRTATTGADHERHRNGTVEPTPDTRRAQRGPLPDDQDAWKDQPAGNLPTGNGISGTIGLIQQHFKRLEVLDREERLGLTAQLAGWPEGEVIASSNDLSGDEAKRVLDQLAKCRNHQALMALVTHGERPGGGDA